MRVIYFFMALCVVILLSGCAVLEPHHTQTPQVNFANKISIQLPAPAALGLNLNATQILTAYAMKKTYTAQVALEMMPKHIVLVALGAWGGQLFSIDYNGKSIKSRRLPIQHGGIGIQQTLLDVILVYGPTHVLRDMLRGTPIQLTVTPLSRVFTISGRPIIKIQYQYKNPWRGKIHLKNFAQHYRINIKTISVGRK